MQAPHVTCVGAQGSGKTTYLRELHADFDGASVFLTPKSRESSIEGRDVSGRQALNTVVTQATGPRDAKAKMYGASYPEDASTAREWSHDVSEHKSWPVQIIIDEAHETLISKSKGPVKDGLHLDRSLGIKYVIATQSPQDLKEQRGYPAVNQCRYITWVGPSRVFQKGFIDHYHLDETDAGLPTEPYRYHVINPSNPPEVVYRGETKEKYA